MCDGNHAADALDQRLTAHFRGTEIGNDDISITTRGRGGTTEPRDDATQSTIAGSGRHRDYGSTAGGELCATHEIPLPANRTDVFARRYFGVYLSREVSFNRRIDGNDSAELAEHF
jgi:hypothetical protein